MAAFTATALSLLAEQGHAEASKGISPRTTVAKVVGNALVIEAAQGKNNRITVERIPGVGGPFGFNRYLVTDSGDTVSQSEFTSTREHPIEAINILAGDGQDVVNCAKAGSVRLYIGGGDGVDVLGGGDAADVISGGPGNDTLGGGNGSDTLDGAGGNDTIYGHAGRDHVFGGAGSDWVTGGYYAGSSLRDGDSNFVAGGPGDDTLQGDRGAETLEGDDGDDVLEGHGGVDDVRGNAGNDTLYGIDDNMNGGLGYDRCGRSPQRAECEAFAP